ncbi:MAG: plasmid mobilization protein [Pseudomonadales bacterium RIFCSPHIGHO2_12_FULL_40_16]|nr:MAG: plasmid mobilization protein [Pseudomonadales bacterium RIFCSPHIGHO2_12_FULL_40_16]
MYYFDLRHNVKELKIQHKNLRRDKFRHSSELGYHYITRTLYFSTHKQDIEELEYTASANMPIWAADSPEVFWNAADQYESINGRTSTHITVALPKELDCMQRIELSNQLIYEFCGQYQMPYSFAIHNHVSTLDGRYEQPHLHLLYSERSIYDGIERTPELYFQRHCPKNPERGGAKKLTADVIGLGRHQINHYRKITENVINKFLKEYAPVNEVEIYGIKFQVENKVSCLSNEDYNLKNGTNLKDVPQIPRHYLHSKDPDIQEKIKMIRQTVKEIREANLYELHQAEYQLELSRRNQYQYENNDIAHKPKSNDFDF